MKKQKRRQNILNKDIIADLIRVAKKNGKCILKEAYFYKHGKYCRALTRQRFGSWKKGLKKAGLPFEVKISKEEYIADIQRVAKKLRKESLSVNDYDKHGSYAARTIAKFFSGKWNKALLTAGLKIVMPKNISIRALTEELKRVAKIIGKKSFTQKEYKKAGGNFLPTICIKLGRESWNRALLKIGCSPTVEKDFSDAKLKKELLRISKKLKKESLGVDEFRNAGGKYYRTAMRNLGNGNWGEALKKVGLRPVLEYDLSKKEMIKELHRISKKLRKKNFSIPEFREAGGKPMKTIKMKLGHGSWNKALSAAGLETKWVQEKASQRIILADIRKIGKKIGKDKFSKREYQQHGGRFDQTAITNHVGTWAQAITKAGFKPLIDFSIADDDLVSDIQLISGIISKKHFTFTEYAENGGKYQQHNFWIHFGSWQKALLAANLFPRVSNEADFLDVCENHTVVKAIVEAFNGNEADIVNVLSIISSGKWSRKKMERWMRKPKLSKWIGRFKKPNLDPKAILEAGFKLMPYEKNGIIKDLLLKQLLAWVDQERGSKPTKTQKLQSIKKLQVYVRKLNAA